MASDLERELLASDNETLASNLDQTSTQPSVSATHSTMNTTNTEQVFQQLAQFLDSKLDQKLASFKRSFDEREDLHASQLKKMKTESKASSSFKFKGNKIQYEFNVASLDSLSMVSKANAELEKHQSLIEKRNKLIRFADKSPAGWTAVDEYQSDDLAEDSEDEKKLRAAERRALTKIKLDKQSKKSTNTRREVQQHRSSFESGSGPQSQTFRGFQPFRQPFRGSRQPQPTDKCFSCGQYGHWASSPVCVNRRRTERQYTASTSQH